MAKPAQIIAPHDAIGSAARTAIALHLNSMLTQVEAARAGEVEAIHRLRVATRRLRAALTLFAPYLRSIKPRATIEELKWIAGEAGKVRNLDIVSALARDRAHKLPGELANALDPLWQRMREQRAQNAAQMAAALQSARFGRVVALLSSTIPITPAADAPFSSIAAQLVRPLIESMRQAGEKMRKDPAPEKIHRLRVRAKRVRYALETMLGMDKGQIGSALKRLAQVQDVLGSYHDAVVAVDWITQAVYSDPLPPETLFAAGALGELIRRRERKLARRALARWKEFIKPERGRALIKKLSRNSSGIEVSSNGGVHHASRAGRGGRSGTGR